ncbi:transcription factor LHW-like [Dorcoceras hygrometricum]|uniref:Transcription factor LHW-like n=1 Tax=Dorcoceras hygrometricum TaxID=472368 RepID=A0A2Z7AEP8_9LAMI|nr:transcription factor LHW-like [Dorcoceras hygrometricum]
MGYLLKEALKTLCGVNQWSYAVFWKFGYQNPKLLIWEECYYELDSKSRHPWIVSGNKNLENVFQDFSNSWVSEENCNLHSGVQAQDRVHLLVNKMMMENHVNIVGEGLVGRVAFTGNHQWILSNNYYGETNLPEVVKEVCQQLSAGIKTIVVIPVLSHGVVQFGSYLSISENMGFINNVTSLVLQLANVPGTLLPDNYASKELGPNIGVPACLGYSTPCDVSFGSNTINASSFVTDSLNYVGSSIPVIPSNTEMLRNQHASLYVPSSSLVLPSGSSPLAIQTTKTISLIGYDSDGNRNGYENIASKCSASSGHTNVNLSKMESSFSVSVDNLMANSLPDYSSANQPHRMDKKCAQSEFFACNEEFGQNINRITDNTLPQQNKHLNTSHFGNYSKYDEPCAQLQSGDDLFDILGADFKNKMFRSCWSSCLSIESTPNKRVSDKNDISSKSYASSEAYGTSQGNSNSVVFSTGTDHLLDAVVSNATPTMTQCTNESVSCRTSLTNAATSSAPNGSLLPYGRFDQVKGELFGVPKYLAKAGAMSSCSLRTLSSKEEKATYSPSSSIYGSQISSLLEKSQNTKQDNSVSSGCSKKPSETNKINRKRLKPGENPRPRPKDRQMIQDRVKELRELVPNGAKCSIDSLLERTIKHMLFLQSVTKHADKLKQTGESKLIGKDGNLLLKENFEGGATWAYEIGLQTMVCPIIVEDLNQPRQMLVEMLCEERGLFLEIAEIIRGLGLTILKGVMETRKDKIWARFAVEANRDVTRMEIFLSLVRVLEQSAEDVLQDKKMIQQFHQAATLPVTGISDIMH